MIALSTAVGAFVGGVTGGSVLNASVGASVAQNAAVNNALSTKNPNYAAKMLGYDRQTFGSMIHDMKAGLGLGGADNVTWHADGSIEFNGKIIGNMHDY